MKTIIWKDGTFTANINNKTITMESFRTVDGYRFKYNLENEMYECRGEICYDDDHDECPEEGLWMAACKLARSLGEGWEEAHSEKGWCEVVKCV